ncbi:MULTISPECIES: UDP-N-acetylglucosamine 2-epimerase [unclassified Sphingobacterium]|uniref:UDP-N-acetylglucosamine 2-epimerase n=1 Tax=unclassified Sphingobacterium TaxID=2609468 RepID=UPI0025FEC4AD|nr:MULTISPECIES: UDP-N-acetylglucosamine 2-epimerase [unclassified Sphingobacterium]
MKKICIVTATRAEYGLLKPLMDLIKQCEYLHLQTIVTGTHLSPEFGLTYRQIESDGFHIDEKVEILLSSDTATSIVKTMALALNGMSDVLPRLSPDLLVVLGDRYEMLAIVSAATIFKIPIAHLHGGEVTDGAYDNSIRHAITKLSHLHFTSTNEYRNRVIQMGENPEQVFNVGAIGLDNIEKLKLQSRQELENELNIKFLKNNYQVTFHPETLSSLNAREQFQHLLKAIDEQQDSYFIFTKSNADTDGRIINEMIDDYVAKNPNKSIAFTSLGSLRFLSLIKECTAIIGNSSAGILEAPSLSTATINIGERQKGRIQADSVINVECNFSDINRGFQKVKDPIFQRKLDDITNPYFQKDVAENILKIILKSEVSIVKHFNNIL